MCQTLAWVPEQSVEQKSIVLTLTELPVSFLNKQLQNMKETSGFEIKISQNPRSLGSKTQVLTLLVSYWRVRKKYSMTGRSHCQAQLWAHVNHITENGLTLIL